MRLLHYLEIRNFKRFGETQRIELGHPTVLIGPNNCGKTTAIQAIALWSQAVKTWFFRRLAERLNHAMLLRKGELHRLIDFVDPAAIPEEVSRKLDLLAALFESARPGEEA